ncbi:MAG: recombinase RecT [Planctomycetia bacterium]
MSEIAVPTQRAPRKFAPEEYKSRQGLDVLKQMGQSIKSSIADAMPTFMRGQAPALLRALYTECQKQPSLLNCTPESLFGCTIQTAQLGLMLGATLGQCYLIPFGGKATLIPGYKGYIQLVNRSGQVGVITAYTVYDGDRYSVEYGTSPKIHHAPGDYPDLAAVERRQSIAYYAVCATKQGTVFQSLTRAEAELHRKKFSLQKGGGPWVNHFDAMAMKTAIIKLCKYLPMSAEVQLAVNIDESSETEAPFDASFLFADATGIEAGEPPSRTAQLAARIATPAADKLAQLIAKLEQAGQLVAFLEQHGVTVENLENSRTKQRSEFADAIVRFQRAAAAPGKLPGMAGGTNLDAIKG